MTTKNLVPPLYGLVLAGGRSRRMGRDKAALQYQEGVPHVRRTAELLGAVCERVFVSCRADQVAAPGVAPAAGPEASGLAALPDAIGRIPDAFTIGGPLNGILSALAAHPGAAFLVAACDLPFLSEESLRTLVAGRDASKPMTVFLNPAREHFPEPLCAIYEPSYPEAARTVMAQGATCPTKIAQALEARTLVPAGADAARFLANANTPEDYAMARGVAAREGHGIHAAGTGPDTSRAPHDASDSHHHPVAQPVPDSAHPEDTLVTTSATKAPATITVEYFAVFRAQARRASEEIPHDGASPAAIYDTLRARYGFALERSSVHVAINDAYAAWEATLNPGDRLVFIPPVSGG